MQRARLVVMLVISGCSAPAPDATPAPGPDRAPPLVAVPPVAARAAPPRSRRPAPPREPIAAWSLTASDGSGLRLVSVEAKAVIEGPLAFTELHLRFANPEDRVREGTFSITLPQRAAISRLAMLEDGRFKEAEVVPRALARRAYDDFLHRGIDPAILEKAAGNEVTARVFPIPARGVKDIVISYSQELLAEGYVLPLRGLPQIDDVSVTLRAVGPGGGAQTQALHEVRWQPDRDFVAEVAGADAVAAGPVVAAAFEIDPAAAGAADHPTALTLLVDTSASRAPGFASYLGRVRALVRELAERYDPHAVAPPAVDPSAGALPAGGPLVVGPPVVGPLVVEPLAIEVIAFDQEARVMYSGPARGFGDAQLAALAERRAAGASDLARAVANLRGPRRIAIVTDGVVTAGAEGAALLRALRELGAERVDVILAGGVRDERVAAGLARAGASPGDVFDLDGELAPVASGLGEAVRVDVPIDVPGATWFYPRTVASLRAGARLVVLARMASPQPGGPLAVTIGGVARAAAVAPGTPALLERAAARAEIDELEAALAAATDPAADPAADAAADAAAGAAASAATRARLRQQIERRSVEARVVSSQTAMLVLDTDADYARYGIDRRALADILVVGPRGVEQQHRTYVASAAAARPAPAAPRGPARAPLTRAEQLAQARGAGTPGVGGADALGAGAYGLLGHGAAAGGSFGVGHGAGMLRARVAAAPAIRLALPSAVSGSLDKAIIRRYLRRYIAQIGYCHDHELLARPHLAGGTVQTRFTIGPAGRVLDVTATGLDEAVAACVAGVIRQIEFPPVNDTTIVVNDPFTFRSADPPAEAPPPSLEQDLAALDQPARVPRPAAAPASAASAPAVPVPAPADSSSAAAAAPAAPADASSAAAPADSSSAAPADASSAAAPADSSSAAAAAAAAPATDGPVFGPPVGALSGKLARVMAAIARRDAPGALALALAWRDAQPTDLLALIGLGEALEASGDRAAAARAYGSIIDLYPTRADLRRFAGERLERLGAAGRALAIDTYRRAVADRPDQLTGHRLLAYALLRAGDHRGAFAAILAGVDRPQPDDRFAGAARVLGRDAGMIAAAYLARGGPRDRVEQALAKRSLALVTAPATRFVLYWETDANDVDLHVRDAAGGHAWFSSKVLPSGGELYADVTTGFGPECFEIQGAPAAGPYQLGVHYYAQGPMGYGMGLLQIVRFDGAAFSFDDRPYVIMKDQAYVALGATR